VPSGRGLAVIGLIGLALVMPGAAAAAPGPTQSTGSLATTRAAAAAAAPAYLGNGYVGTRIPADGAGYESSPVATETHIAGVYASVPDAETGGVQRQGSINLPGWTQLDVLVAGQRYASADARSYRQELDLRRGILSTSAIWSAGRRVTEVRYDVVLDRARKRVGLVRLRLIPRWSGNLRVRDVLGAGAYRQSLRPVTVTGELQPPSSPFGLPARAPRPPSPPGCGCLPQATSSRALARGG
jgi:hypothetical protein